MRQYYCGLIWLCFPAVCLSAERFTAMFADGGRTEEAEVREWFEPGSQPKIGGRNLFDPTSPARWIIDRSQPPGAKPAMYVEFVGGDQLAGEVIGYLDGLKNPYEVKPPHLVVKPDADVQPPDVVVPAEVRITTDWVQRIVWEHVGSEELRPGTVWLRNGTSVTYRSLRWTAAGVTLLTQDGVKDLLLSDLGEIHFPKINPWTAYVDQLAVISPDAKSRIIQLQCIDGSRWTTSTERFQARHYGDRNRPEQWFQLIQPAWSLDSIWVRYRTIRGWRFFAPHEAPLSNFSPAQVKHQGMFGAGWEWQADLNALRGPLQSLDKEFGWGLGVQGSSELIFELPELARAVRTQFGLDRVAGTGGCVNIELLAGNQSLMKHANLIGAAFVSSLDWLPLPAASPENRRITLRTDMAHTGRPPGADPFDVRDIINWYEPEIRLDQPALTAEVASRGAARVAGLVGWTISADDNRLLRTANIVDTFDGRDPQIRRVVRSMDRFYLLSRKVRVGPNDRWLAIAASRFNENTSPTTMQIRVDDRVLGEYEVPVRYSLVDPEPLLIPISNFQGRSVSVDVAVYTSDDKSWVDWRGFAIGPDRPGLLTLFEDDEKFASVLNRGSSRVELDTDKPYSGKRSLKMATGTSDNPAIPKLDALICEQPQLGQYRYVVFAWKKATGTRLQIQFANQGRFVDGNQPLAEHVAASRLHDLRRTQTIDERGQRFGYSYETGTVSPQTPFPISLNGNLPRDWQIIQRDMFGDFGLFWLTGLGLNNVDGESAWFDHMYLARTNVDLEYVASYLVNPQSPPPQPDGNGMMSIPRRDDFASEFSRIAPLFSSIDMSHGLMRQVMHNGQTDVLRTHANAQDKPLILRAGFVLPKDQPKLLDLHVSNQPDADWQLIVKVNRETLHDQLIDDKLTRAQRGWATVQVDLAKFAGQKVLIEVLNQSNNWQNETAFWKRIELIDR